jgi:hypothetical protein
MEADVRGEPVHRSPTSPWPMAKRDKRDIANSSQLSEPRTDGLPWTYSPNQRHSPRQLLLSRELKIALDQLCPPPAKGGETVGAPR